MQGVIKKIAMSSVFIIGLAVLLLLSSVLLCPKNNDKKSGIIDPAANGILSEPHNTIDVLVVGDSESYSAIIPMNIWKQHGITTYCCGTSGQLLSYSEQFIHKAFKSQSPKVIILETNAIFRKISFDKALMNKIEAFFSVFTYHNRWKTLKRNDLVGDINYTYIDDAKGYYFSTKVREAEKTDHMKETSEYEPIRSMNYYYVKKIKELCDSKGASLVLLSTPSTVNWNSKRHNTIKELAEELDVDYIDMNKLQNELSINWKKDTRDKGDHLNHFGAVKVTEYLGNYLAENKQLGSHKNDAAYASWDKAQEIFNKKVEKTINNSK